MKNPVKNINVKTMTRVATSLVGVIAAGILVLTAWFIMKTLDEVAVAKTSNGAKQLRIEGVNTQLLEKAMTFRDEKTAESRKIGPNLPNPFSRPAPAVQPAPAPAPAPTPTPEPQPTPAPAPTQ